MEFDFWWEISARKAPQASAKFEIQTLKSFLFLNSRRAHYRKLEFHRSAMNWSLQTEGFWKTEASSASLLKNARPQRSTAVSAHQELLRGFREPRESPRVLGQEALKDSLSLKHFWQWNYSIRIYQNICQWKWFSYWFIEFAAGACPTLFKHSKPGGPPMELSFAASIRHLFGISSASAPSLLARGSFQKTLFCHDGLLESLCSSSADRTKGDSAVLAAEWLWRPLVRPLIRMAVHPYGIRKASHSHGSSIERSLNLNSKISTTPGNWSAYWFGS